MFCTVVKWCWWMMHEDMQMGAIQLPAEVAGLWFTSLTHPPPLSLSLSPLWSLWWGACLHVWTYSTECAVVLPSHCCPSLLQSALIDMEKLVVCSHKLKIASAMQISIQQAFVEVCFFQAPQLFPTRLQKPAVAYPKGRRAFNSIMCGKRQQLYALSSAWLAPGCTAN